MRKETYKIAKAFYNRRPASAARTKTNGDVVWLHDNLIASINWATQCIAISDAGWQTNTTKSRLNALLQGLGNRAHIHQKNFVWHLTRGLDATEAYVTEMERGQAYAVSL